MGEAHLRYEVQGVQLVEPEVGEGSLLWEVREAGVGRRASETAQEGLQGREELVEHADVAWEVVDSHAPVQ